MRKSQSSKKIMKTLRVRNSVTQCQHWFWSHYSQTVANHKLQPVSVPFKRRGLLFNGILGSDWFSLSNQIVSTTTCPLFTLATFVGKFSICLYHILSFVTQLAGLCVGQTVAVDRAKRSAPEFQYLSLEVAVYRVWSRVADSKWWRCSFLLCQVFSTVLSR